MAFFTLQVLYLSQYCGRGANGPNPGVRVLGRAISLRPQTVFSRTSIYLCELVTPCWDKEKPALRRVFQLGLIEIGATGFEPATT